MELDGQHDDSNGGNGEPVNLVLEGAANGTLATTDGDMQALVSTFSGQTKGTFTGSYQGQQVALVYRSKEGGDKDGHSSDDVEAQHGSEYTTDRAKVMGISTLIVPDHEVGKNSTYKLAMQGWITDCCAKDFNFEGNVKSIDATGRFEGTQIKGKVTSKTDLGYPQRLKVKGKKIDK
ncbi:hypothetical protein [Halorussus ruber]|uniref:hypothetical protein n=1 Tax=Halorussus ruber TaxID=1126238 RepID=UPI001091A770|nr:hypothetical protein [Halorussus ruber]